MILRSNPMVLFVNLIIMLKSLMFFRNALFLVLAKIVVKIYLVAVPEYY